MNIASGGKDPGEFFTFLILLSFCHSIDCYFHFITIICQNIYEGCNLNNGNIGMCGADYITFMSEGAWIYNSIEFKKHLFNRHL